MASFDSSNSYYDPSKGVHYDPLGIGNASQKKKKKAADLFNQLSAEQQQKFMLAEKFQKQILANIDAATGKVTAQVNRGADTSRQDVMNLGKQNAAAMTQSMTNRGLGNTTAYQNMQRGVNADTARGLSNVNNTLAQNLAQVYTNQAQLKSQGLGSLSQMYQNWSGEQTNLGLNAFNALKQPPRQRSGLFGGLGGLIGMGLTAATGGAAAPLMGAFNDSGGSSVDYWSNGNQYSYNPWK